MATRLRYPELAPDGYAALSGFGHYVNTGTALEPVLLGLVHLRASVLNGCHFCVELHKMELRKHHESESRIEAVSSAPDSDAFTPREQAALQWTEVMTRLGSDPASDDQYAAVTRFFQGKEIVDLTFAIANINAWNRMGIAFRPTWRPRVATSPVQEEREPALRAVEAKPMTSLHAGEGQPVRNAASEAEDDGGKVATD